MDVLQVIQNDHEEFRQQVADLSASASDDPERSVDMFREFYSHVTAHHEAEEKLLFKRLEGFPDAREAVDEAWEEHEAAHSYLERMKRSHKTERWEAKVSVLKEIVEHHMEEEESQVFDAVRTHLQAELEQLGEKFEAAEAKQLSK